MRQLIVIGLNACKCAVVFKFPLPERISVQPDLWRGLTQNQHRTLQKSLLMCMSSIFVAAHSFPHRFQLLDFRELTGISSYQKALHPCCAAPLQNPHYKHQAGKRHWSRNSHHTFLHLIPARKKKYDIFSSNLVKSLAADHTNMMEPQWGQRKQLRRQLIRSQHT